MPSIRFIDYLSLVVEYLINNKMESTFALKGDGYVMLISDCTSARSIMAFKHDEDKVSSNFFLILMINLLKMYYF